MPFIKNKFLRKIICLGLSVALIYNTTVPAFGQEFLYTPPEMPTMAIDHTYFDNTRAEVQAFIIETAVQEHKRKMEDPRFARAQEIMLEILGDEQKELIDEHFRNGGQEKKEINFKEEYSNSLEKDFNEAKEIITTKYQRALQQIKDIEKEALAGVASGEFTQEEFDAWRAEEKVDKKISDLQRNYRAEIAQIEEYRDQELDRINNHYEDFLQELQQGAMDAFFEHVKELFAELMNIYKADPNQAKEQILAVTPVIVSLVNSRKERVYNAEQQNILIKLYRKFIEEESAKVGQDKSILTNPCEHKGYCTDLTNSIMGLGVLSEAGSDGNLIMKTIEKYEDTAANVTIMLSGMSALLVMKNYSLIDSYLRRRTDDENEIDYWDFLSFINIPKHVANVYGKYLGNSSMKAEYYNGKQFQNAYFDLAQILAEDGSDGALDLLKKYGINKCAVAVTSGVQKETLSKYSISCSGIMPFLVGALLSGKSGANGYKLQRPIYGSQYMTADGRIHDFDPNRYDYEMRTVNIAENNYYSLARNVFNGDAEAMLAFYVMNEGMGDLNDVDEYNLDTSLYNVFKNRIPSQFLGAKRIVVDAERLAKKETRRTVTAVFEGIGLGVDIALTIWFVWDIAVAGVKILAFGKNLFNAIRLAKVGLSVKNIPTLAKIAANYTKTVFMQQKFVVKIQKMGTKFKNFSKEYKAAVRLNVLQHAANYTNAIHQQAEVSLNIARMGLEITPDLIKSANQIRYSQRLGAFVVETGEARTGFNNAMRGIRYNEDIGLFTLGNIQETGLPETIAETVNNILDTATINAKASYRVSKLFNKGRRFSEIFLEEAGRLIDASPLAAEEKQALNAFIKSSEFSPALTAADTHINSLASLRHSSRDFATNPLTLLGFTGEAGQNGQRIGAEFVIGEKMPAFAKKIPESAYIVQDGERFILKFFRNGNEAIDLSSFKLAFENTGSFADFARASATLGDAGKIELKFIPKEANSFWTRNFTNVFAPNKARMFAGRGKVFILGKDGKTLTETGITLRTYKKYDGLRLIIQENLGGAIDVYKGLDPLRVSTEGAFFLPKYAIGDFLNIAKARELDAPYKIKLLGGINKVNALYLQSMVSLSVASTGLYRALSKNYPDMNTKELSFISLIFPYLLSAGTPLVSPFVKKFGAIKILKTSMYLSLASLAIPIMSGFHGFGGIQADNPFDKPSPYLLYPSALLIGLATTLTRGSYSPLIQSIGGGSGTLKAVAFKSISSFMLILPPAAGALLDYIRPKFFLNPDGSEYLDENGQPIKKHWFDFSFSYPVLLAISGLALYKIQKAHFNPEIGKSANSVRNVGEFFQDVGASYRLLGRRDLLPLTLSSALLAGAESSLLYAYSNSMASEYVGNKVHTEALVPIIALLGLNLPAFVTRMNSKAILKGLGGDNMFGYRNLLTFGLASAGAGSYLLATQDDPLTFSIGLALTSVGFSQITSSILRYGHKKLEFELANAADKRLITSWDVSYPTVYIGMSAVPYLYGAMADRNIAGLETADKGDMVSLKNTSWQEVMWVPISALGLGGGLSYIGMRPKTALRSINSGHLISPLGLTAEAHNPAFTTLALPRPNFNTPAFYQQPTQSDIEPNLHYNPELFIPSGFRLTPNISIQPMRH